MWSLFSLVLFFPSCGKEVFSTESPSFHHGIPHRYPSSKDLAFNSYCIIPLGRARPGKWKYSTCTANTVGIRNKTGFIEPSLVSQIA